MKAKRCAIAVLMVAAPVLAWGQQAGEVRKCVSSKGAVSFQQAPCSAGGREVSSHAYVTERAPTAEQLRARAVREQAARAESAELSRRAGTMPGPARQTGGGALHRVSIARDDAACQRARRHREQTLAAVGMKRTYDLLRTLNNQVAEACR